jgi:hypothetical protein
MSMILDEQNPKQAFKTLIFCQALLYELVLYLIAPNSPILLEKYLNSPTKKNN